MDKLKSLATGNAKQKADIDEHASVALYDIGRLLNPFSSIFFFNAGE